MKKTTIIQILFVAAFLALDQLTKFFAVQALSNVDKITVIPHFIYFDLETNNGAGWSLFSGNMPLLYGVTVVAAGLFFYMLKDGDINNKKLYTYGILLMVAGGLGNFVDRLLFQEVFDFIDVDLWSYTTYPTFNVADMCLVVGMIMFAVDVIVEDVIKWKKSKS